MVLNSASWSRAKATPVSKERERSGAVEYPWTHRKPTRHSKGHPDEPRQQQNESYCRLVETGAPERLVDRETASIIYHEETIGNARYRGCRRRVTFRVPFFSVEEVIARPADALTR